jgi:plastocyanin
MSRLVLLACAAAAFSLLGAGGARSSDPTLEGVVGTNDAFSITLKDASGNRVTHLDPGSYTVVVHDRSTLHDFHLFGPGVDMSTEVETKSDVTWQVTFVDGTYRYQCDPHSNLMHGSFTVGTVSQPTPLTGTVGPRRTISLKNADGTRVGTLAAGSYRITVRDRSRTDNFHLSGPGVNKKTGVGFRGTVRWTVALSAGKYVYRSDRHRALRRTFSVTS